MKKRLIYYDTETTGLKAGVDRIIEIAAFDPVLNKSFSELINPEMPIPEMSTKICNITDEMVKDKPTFHEVGKRFAEFCTEGSVLTAHNNDSFDKHFVEKEFKRCSLELPEHWIYLDTLKWARKYRSDLPKHSLQYLREIYNVEANQAHRAFDDVMVLYKIFSQMIDDLTADQILSLIYSDIITSMPFGKHTGKPLKEVPKKYILWLKENGVFDKQENTTLKQNFEKLGVLT